MSRSIQSGALTRRQTENHRSAIRVGELLTRLQKFALGELQNSHGEDIEMSKEQITAAVKVMDKALPNLQVTENINIEEKPTIEQIKERLNSLVLANPELIDQLAQARAEQMANDNALEEVKDALPDKGQEAQVPSTDEQDGDKGAVVQDLRDSK